MPTSLPQLLTVSARQHFVTGLLTHTQGTSLAPTPYEQQLLQQYVRGELTLEQVLTALKTADSTR